MDASHQLPLFWSQNRFAAFQPRSDCARAMWEEGGRLMEQAKSRMSLERLEGCGRDGSQDQWKESTTGAFVDEVVINSEDLSMIRELSRPDLEALAISLHKKNAVQAQEIILMCQMFYTLLAGTRSLTDGQSGA
ncbi:hypothetical protein EVJ58_g6475 [Rhodofomes roseus]|uniref:Uncharacterized protein n=1 Tax=Rhodofomes roseus TaxID=34475 RepID=A0A4Y9Y7K8_9APHY|nr:hypothetical protein EVJ58_g6475 [Rhodofomes roseus]